MRALWQKRFSSHLLLALLLATACRKQYQLAFDEKQLAIANGRLFYRGQPLDGEVTREYGGVNARQITTYRNGVEHGPQRTWAENGRLVEERQFRDGRKTGVHRGFFPDGSDRFFAEFENDRYVNEFWSWHANGKVAEFKHYDSEGRALVHKQWRESGQIYRNEVFAENLEQGMPGVKLCNSVKETVGRR
ncbi:MAG: toxin-antitoxin system YwqK family antitoxin [Spirochaetota bacterium]